MKGNAAMEEAGDAAPVVRRANLTMVWAVGLALGVAGYEAVWWKRSGSEAPVRNEVEVRGPHEVSVSMKEHLAEMLLVATANQPEMSEEDGRMVVRMVRANPDRINPLWQGIDSERRLARMSEIFTKLACDCPAEVWRMWNRMRYPPRDTPQLVEAMKAGAAAAPLQVLSGRSKPYRLAPEVMAVLVKDRRAVRIILDSSWALGQLGGPAVEALFAPPDFWATGGRMPEGSEPAREWKDEYERKLRVRAALMWLNGGEMSRAEISKLTPADLSDVLARTERIRPDCLETLAGLFPIQQVREIPPMLVQMGKTAAAVELVKGLKGMPVVGEEWEGMMERVVRTSYAATRDRDSSLALCDGLEGPALRRQTRIDILTQWAAESPETAREYLPRVEDDEIREQLEKTIEESSLR